MFELMHWQRFTGKRLFSRHCTRHGTSGGSAESVNSTGFAAVRAPGLLLTAEMRWEAIRCVFINRPKREVAIDSRKKDGVSKGLVRPKIRNFRTGTIRLTGCGFQVPEVR